jgi:hypothetical protein
VGVVAAGQAGADVEELADARVGGQVVTARPRKARFFLTPATMSGYCWIISSAASRSALKLSLPPSQ